MRRPAICLASLVLAAGSLTAQGPVRHTSPAPRKLEVVSVTPPVNALAVSRSTTISIQFNRKIDVAGIQTKDFHVFGKWSAITPGTMSLMDGGKTLQFEPNDPFSAGELVTVMLSRNVRGAAGERLDKSFAWSFWADSRASSVMFTQVDTLFPGNTPYGSWGGDVDADEDLDLLIPNENSSDVSVFLNGGSGNYGTSTEYAVGFHCSANEAADFDFDGDVDFTTANILHDDVSILMGNGDGSFQPQVRHDVGDGPRGLTVLDADGDGDLEIVTANRNSSDISILFNNGDGTFADETRIQGGVSGETAISACDMNNDGLFDLVVTGHGDARARVLLGDGNGSFTQRPFRDLGVSTWMVVTGDVNGDGFNDIAAAMPDQATGAISFGDGTGLLGAATHYPSGSFPIAIDLGDLDGDGLLDLAVSAFLGVDFSLYFNQGGGAMGGLMTLPAISSGSCTVLHDFDGDGDVDVTAIDELIDRIFLYAQDG